MNTGYFMIMAGIALFYIVLNGITGSRYRNELEPLDEKQYGYKKLLPFGLWLFDAANIPAEGAYSIFLYQRVVMVYGTRYARYYLKIHWAMKFMYLFLGMVLASFIGAASNSGWGYFPIIPVSGVILFFLADKSLDEKASERRLQLMMDFPVFISKLTLLMNAGMHLRQALERIYNDALHKTPLYSELGLVLEDLEAGIGEVQAWQEFSERCKVKEVASFASMIVQNSKIGGNQMVEELKRMTHETWEMRKQAAKQMGETASSRLIFPLMLIFLAILLIVVTPAIMQFSQVF